MQAIEENRKGESERAGKRLNSEPIVKEGYFDRGTLKSLGIDDIQMEGLDKVTSFSKKARKHWIVAEAELIADKIIKDVHKGKRYEESSEIDFNFHNSSTIDDKKQSPTHKKFDLHGISNLHQSSKLTNESRVNYSASIMDESHFNASHATKSVGKTAHKIIKPSTNQHKKLMGPSREAISLIFHYSSLSYKTSNFIGELKELTRNLQKTFNAYMGELVVVDPQVINIMSDSDGQGIAKLKEEMADSTEVVVIRTSLKMPGYSKVDEAASSTLTTMCNEINVMKFKRRIVFKRGKLLAPITLSFGPESKKLSGNFR